MESIEEFARSTEHVEDREHLAARLRRGDRLRIKWGVDPTAPDIHLGHTVPMRALRRWQVAGHVPVIIIGDWTARIGDPSGRNQARPPLAADRVAANAATYLEQLFSILDRAATEVRFQSEWFDPMGLAEVIRLASSRSVQQLLQRNDFSERLRGAVAISAHELLYPLLQGYDSVAVDADVEIGGTDQLFNLLAARDVQRFYERSEPQDVVTFPLLLGLDGERKMSKSYDNYIGVAEPPGTQYGKAMSIPDGLILSYMELATDMESAEVERHRRALARDDTNPRDAKAALAASIVAQFHGAAAAASAAAEFERVHRGGGLPAEVPGVATRLGEREALPLLREVSDALGTGLSGAQLKALLRQGGVRYLPPHGEWTTLTEGDAVRVADGGVLRLRKRTFARLGAAPRADAPAQ